MSEIAVCASSAQAMTLRLADRHGFRIAVKPEGSI